MRDIYFYFGFFLFVITMLWLLISAFSSKTPLKIMDERLKKLEIEEEKIINHELHSRFVFHL